MLTGQIIDNNTFSGMMLMALAYGPFSGSMSIPFIILCPREILLGVIPVLGEKSTTSHHTTTFTMYRQFFFCQ